MPGAIGRFCLVLITHDKSTFYQNDQHQIRWGCPGSGAPKPKGEGTSLMVSDFLSANWGRLKDSDRCVLLAPFPSNLSHLHLCKKESQLQSKKWILVKKSQGKVKKSQKKLTFP